MQREYLIDLEDVVEAVKNAKGKVKLHQPLERTAVLRSRVFMSAAGMVRDPATRIAALVAAMR